MSYANGLAMILLAALALSDEGTAREGSKVRLRLVTFPNSGPVPRVRVRFVNEGSRRADVLLHTDAEYRDIRLGTELIGPDGVAMPYVPAANRLGAVMVIPLPPGSSWEGDASLLSCYDLGKPGTYRLTACYTPFWGTIEDRWAMGVTLRSNTISIVISSANP